MRTVAIPIEIKKREFLGKLWLGLNLLQRGYQVVLGPSWEVKKSLDYSQPNVYITKDPGDNNSSWFDYLRTNGVIVCGLDTEGGVYDSDERFSQNKTEVLNHLDAFFAWGKKPAEAIKTRYDNDCDNLYITGNPRFDLLQPDIRYIYKKMSMENFAPDENYILINGTFTTANPFTKKQNEKTEERYGELSTKEISSIFRIFHLFIESIHGLADELDDSQIIIRPHPGESNEFYEDEFSRYENVCVNNDGDVRTWIINAKAVIHHDSTTGIESALAGTHPISYQPIRNPYENELAQKVSITAKSYNQIVSELENIRENQIYKMSDDQKFKLNGYFHNIDERSTDHICDIIDRFEMSDNISQNGLAPDFYGDIERRIASSRWSESIKATFDTVYDSLNKTEQGTLREYRRRKFPALDGKEIREYARLFNSVLSIDVESMIIQPVKTTKDTFILNDNSSKID